MTEELLTWDNTVFERKKFKQTWRNVVQRCTNPIDKRYSYYSKLGICDEWLKYENFYDDLFVRFWEHSQIHGLKDTTIERIDNTKGYIKGNVRWATWEEQRANRTTRRRIFVEKECLNCPNKVSVWEKTVMVFCSAECKNTYLELRHAKSVEQQKIKQSLRQKRRYANPDWKKRHNEQVRKNHYRRYKTDPEYKKQADRYIHEYHKRQWHSNPEYRAKVRKYAAKRYRTKYQTDPLFRQKELERRKQYKPKQLSSPQQMK